MTRGRIAAMIFSLRFLIVVNRTSLEPLARVFKAPQLTGHIFFEIQFDSHFRTSHFTFSTESPSSLLDFDFWKTLGPMHLCLALALLGT